MSEIFGTLPDGREVRRYRLRCPGGGELRLLDLGATVQGYRSDADDPASEVVVHFDALDDYVAARQAYLGAVVGRYANRIAGASFVVDGRSYTLTANEGTTALHGGVDGFDQRVWTVVEESDDTITFELTSPDGDQGFPGALLARASYRVLPNGFRLDLTASTDAPTVALLTSHVYVNTVPGGSTDEQDLTVDASGWVPIDSSSIPFGRVEPVAGTPFDLRRGVRVADVKAGDHDQIRRASGTDHSFDIDGVGFRRHARLADRASGRFVEVWSDQPALQVFTSNFDESAPQTADGTPLPRGLGVALEPQEHPDAPHQRWSSDAVLRPGDVWSSRIEWRVG